MKGYLYKITWTPEGLMYFGSRKTPEGLDVLADSYMGSPKGSNRMRELFDTRPDSEFTKEVLTVGLYEDIIELEPLLIQESWDKWGKESEGGLVCNLVAGKSVIQTDEIKAKISAAQKGVKRGPHSAEAKAKMSVARRRRPPPSAETRAKISAAQKGRTFSAESKAKMSAAKKGKKYGPRSAEAKARMAAAQKAYWAKRKATSPKGV